MDGFLPTFLRREQAPPKSGKRAHTQPSVRPDVPKRVVIPLQDHPDDPYEVLVEKDQQVAMYQQVGICGSETDSIVAHASVSGKVVDIGSRLHPLGSPVISVTIEACDNGLEVNTRPFREWDGSSVSDFLRQKGLPLSYGCFDTCSVLVVNVTEFEPSFTSGCRLLFEEPEEVTSGLKILLEACSADRAVVMVEKKQPDVVMAVEDICRAVDNVRMEAVDSPCPVTVHELTALQCAYEKNQADTRDQNRMLVVDPQMLVAVHNAYVLGIPFVEQLIALSGSGVHAPHNMWVRHGTMLADIILQAGGNVSTIGRVNIGGPMIGLPQHTLEVPIIKPARGIFAAVALAFDEEHHSRFYQRCACVRCGKCVDVCPAGIVPNIIAELVESRRAEEAAEMGLFSCLECGLCHYICPSIIPLVELFKLGKVRLKGTDALLTFRSFKMLSGEPENR